VKQGLILRPALAAGFLLVVAPAFAAGDINASNGMPNRISMNCTTAKGKPVTDPATCASEACVDAAARRSPTRPSAHRRPPASPRPSRPGS
jgi:hypothetical protein